MGDQPAGALQHQYGANVSGALYAALNTATGEILAKTANRHTSAQFVEFLAQVVATQPAKTRIHIIADNLSTHKTTGVHGFLSANPNIKLHYSPTYSNGYRLFTAGVSLGYPCHSISMMAQGF